MRPMRYFSSLNDNIIKTRAVLNIMQQKLVSILYVYDDFAVIFNDYIIILCHTILPTTSSVQP